MSDNTSAPTLFKIGSYSFAVAPVTRTKHKLEPDPANPAKKIKVKTEQTYGGLVGTADGKPWTPDTIGQLFTAIAQAAEAATVGTGVSTVLDYVEDDMVEAFLASVNEDTGDVNAEVYIKTLVSGKSRSKGVTLRDDVAERDALAAGLARRLAHHQERCRRTGVRHAGQLRAAHVAALHPHRVARRAAR